LLVKCEGHATLWRIMIYYGKVKGQSVKLHEPIPLPEGSSVEVVIHPFQAEEDNRWVRFLTFPFSARARGLFQRAGIWSIDQLTGKTAREVFMWRGAGRSVLTEVRMGLARVGLSLKGEPVYDPAQLGEREALQARLRMLHRKQSQIQVRIQQLKLQIAAQKEKKKSLSRSS
jgi:hypothetical protein